VEWADLNSHGTVGARGLVKIEPHQQSEQDWPRYGPGGVFGSIGLRVNELFWEDLAEYLWARSLVRPVGISAFNSSSNVAENVRIVLKLPRQDTAIVVSEDELPPEPSEDYMNNQLRDIKPASPSCLTVRALKSHWEIEFKMGSIQPKAQAWATEPIYLGTAQPQTLDFETTVYADNIGEPQKSKLSLDIQVEHRPALTMDDLRAYDEQTDRP
jgi:hypothetical protein